MSAVGPIAACDAVETFRGWEREARKALRRRLLKIRDRAAARATSTRSETARELYWRASLIAGEWAFQHSVPDSELEAVANSLVWLGLAATKFDEIEGING